MSIIFCEICHQEHELWICPTCGVCLVKFGVDKCREDSMEYTRCNHCKRILSTGSPCPVNLDLQDPRIHEQTFDQEWGTEGEEHGFPLDETGEHKICMES